ncbi:lactonase family protein [Streptomyces sp. GMY02]|uniref:lactonase family protein n=1 Tax=Streptomyces sp. GMY02 TaxID=1333528 RepID=UPI001C2C5102|nr:beta-propeller fold lactonase family protein [Streptomyces sp. GMY02]QXE33723.1 lactonase family protein [Streptomyces sp. GMY02]
MRRAKTFVRIARIATAVTVAMAALTIPASADSERHAGGHPGRVFVQTDSTSGNKIVAYHRAEDGTLHKRGVFATDGKGGILEGSVVDHLASQGSLTYDARHNLLYAVNAGSDSVTVFSVDGERLRRKQVIHSGGTFPVSVTVHQDRVFVLNARKGGSIQGFRLTEEGLRRVPEWHRALRLNTAATPEFLHTPGQVAFTPDGSRLVVTTKMGGNSIVVFPVAPSGAPAPRPVVSSKSGSAPFGLTFDRRGRLVVADAGPNAVLTFRIEKDSDVTLLDDILTGQQASCWVVRAGNRFYVSNAGSNTVSGFQQTREAHLRALGNTPTGTGTVDSAVTPDNHFLYVQTGGVGAVDGFRVNDDGSLTKISTTPVPDAVGGEGIVVL